MPKKAVRKKLDKWKLKKWYEVYAPEYLNSKYLGDIISGNPENLMNRILEIPVVNVTEVMKPEMIYSNLWFRVKHVDAAKVLTEVVGYNVAFSYLRSLARRRRSVIHHVVDVETKDDKKVRVKAMLVTQKKVSSTVKRNLRKAFEKSIVDNVRKRTYPEFVKAVIDGQLNAELFREINKINPVGHILVKKFELFEQFR